MKIKHGQFLDDEGDIIADKVLKLFTNYSKIKNNKDLKSSLSGLFYNDIHDINFEHYDAPDYLDFSISTLPGQCSNIVIHDLVISKSCRESFIKIINDLSIGLGFSNIIITLDEDESDLNHLLLDNHFEIFKKGYKNQRTNNKINYYLKCLY